jgi:hypothetical protein
LKIIEFTKNRFNKKVEKIMKTESGETWRNFNSKQRTSVQNIFTYYIPSVKFFIGKFLANERKHP